MKRSLLAMLAITGAVTATAPGAAAETAAVANERTSMDMTIEMNETRRRAVVASNIRLDDKQAKAFWPLYDAYRDEVKSVELDVMENIQTFAAKFNDLDEATSTALLKNALKIEAKVADLREAHLKKVQSVLPPVEALRYFQLDGYLDTTQRRAVQSQIPLAGDDLEALIERRQRIQKSSGEKSL
ncbi:MAG: Spy/CpxP family protein refolding chaperone [Pseudomonadota bacterium]